MELTLANARDLDRLLSYAATLPKDEQGKGEPVLHNQYVKEVLKDDDKETYFYYIYLTQSAFKIKDKYDANWFSQDNDAHIRANAATKEFLKNGGFVSLIEKERHKEEQERIKREREDKATKTTILNNQFQAYALILFLAASVAGAAGEWAQAHWAKLSYKLYKKELGIVDPPPKPVREIHK
jgi:hypothetical protein